MTAPFTLFCFRARSKKWQVTVTDSDGTAINLTGKTLRFRAAASWDAGHLIELSSGAGITHADQSSSPGVATISLSPALTDTTDFATTRTTRLDYMLDLIDGSDTFTAQSGPLNVQPSLA
jgi:hypothetical protein